MSKRTLNGIVEVVCTIALLGCVLVVRRLDSRREVVSDPERSPPMTQETLDLVLAYIGNDIEADTRRHSADQFPPIEMMLDQDSTKIVIEFNQKTSEITGWVTLIEAAGRVRAAYDEDPMVIAAALYDGCVRSACDRGYICERFYPQYLEKRTSAFP